ncbi:MAG: hypothetical protein J0M02_04830 [Planctomycetes bacterium]|nr:hypothetical protein [Planctomycetota bacterium]
MQLDSHLVERFHALHRQRLSGLLQTAGDGFALGICLVDGEPVAIDLGEDLERLFANACRVYHKLDDAGLAELEAALAGGAKARDYLVQRQLVSEAEADQVAQAVVEDALTRAFRGPCTTVEFKQGVSPEQLPVGRSALKMRIGVEALIRTCDQRVSEHQAVEREIGGWDSVFALNEAEHSAGQLGEYEKMVLNFVDGRATVEQIAELCRDSSLNLGRVLRSLLSKQVISRVDQHKTSGVRPAIGAAPSGQHKALRTGSGTVQPAAQPEQAAAPARQLREMEVYRAPPQSGNRPIVLVGLIALLAISLGVAFLVIQYNGKQQRMREDEAEIARLLGSRQWQDARSAIGRLRQAAGNDLTAIRTVDGLGTQVESAITAERAAIISLIETEDFPAARTRIASLPDEGDLQRRLREAEAEARLSAGALADEIRARLTNGDIAGALAAVDDATGVRAADAAKALVLWRNDTLVIARSQTHPLHVRIAAIARLRQARPDAAMQGQLAQLEQDLQGQLKSLMDRLSRIEAVASSGAWAQAKSELEGLRIGDSGSGTPLEARAAQAAAVIKRVSEELGAATDVALRSLSEDAPVDGLTAARERLQTLLRTYPQASGREALERVAGALAACAAGGGRAAAERALEATSLAQQASATEDADLIAALQARAQRIGAIEAQARISLVDAQRMGRSGDWQGAVAALKDIIAQPAWRATAVRREAEIELEAAQAQAARRLQLKQDLRMAMTKGDLAACEGIAREIGLAYLPVVVSSQPEAAEVVGADGKVLGSTPLILDVSADERVDLSLTLRKPGYKDAMLSGAQAEGGWRLTARLERSAILALDLPHPLTVRPGVAAGRLWLGDRSRIVSLERPDANAVRSTLVGAAAALSEPVFAPVSSVDDSLLLATREGLALRVGRDAMERLPLPAASDHAILAHHSQLVIGRNLLIVAANEGRIIAVQSGSVAPVWQTPAGAPLVGEMRMVGEDILFARADGTLERVRAEDGRSEGARQLGQPVISVWATPDGIAGLSDSSTWAWTGGEVVMEALPERAIGGGPDVMVGVFGKIWLRGQAGWQEMGRLDPRPQPGQSLHALAWVGQAVVAHGPRLSVFGSTPFRVDAGSDLLPPTVWDGALVAASLEGKVWVWKP